MKSDLDFTPNIHMNIKPKIKVLFWIVIIFVNLNIIIIQIYSETQKLILFKTDTAVPINKSMSDIQYVPTFVFFLFSDTSKQERGI